LIWARKQMSYRCFLAAISAFVGLASLKFELAVERTCRTLSADASVLPVVFLCGVTVTSLALRWISSLIRHEGDTRSVLSRCGDVTILGLCVFGAGVLAGSNGTLGRWLIVTAWLICHSAATEFAFHIRLPDHMDGTISRRGKLRLLAIVVGAGLCTLVIAVTEVVCSRLLARQPPGAVKVYAGEYLDPGAFFRQDSDLGIALEPNRRVGCRLNVDGRLVWDVHYGTDQYGRRRSLFPGTQVPSATAVFFGCSFLFGEGAEDGQTIPSKFNSLSSGFLAANYGVPGWGTQHMLALLQSGTLKSQMVAPVKLGVYLYLPEAHESRVVGDMDIINSFGAGFPCYELDAAGAPVRLGTFSSARPLTVGLYGLLGKSSTRAILGLNFPRRTARHYLLTAALIERSKDLFLEQFPDSRFLVVAFPDPDPETATLKTVRENGVEVLDLAALFDATDPQYQHVGDGHPTPAANGLVAEAIVRHVQHPE
jgi:hypothetical protein